MKRVVILLAFALGCAARADDLAKSFPVGAGSKFQFVMENAPEVELIVSVAASAAARLSIEYYFTTATSIIPIEMWQQYVLESKGSGAPKLVEGYVFAKELKQPEKVTSEYLKGFDGVAMNDFLFGDKAQLDKLKVADESVTVPAGTVKSTHYRQSRSGQTVDFWISDEAKPIGLVKLVSTGAKRDHKYELSLLSLLKNVARKIDPAQAKPLSEKGRGLLAAPAVAR
jgi:hypothetical protein